MKNFVKEKINTTAKHLKSLIVVDKQPIECFDYTECGYKGDARPPMPDNSWGTLPFGAQIKGADRHFWLYKKIKTPKQPSADHKLYFELKTGKEGGWDASNPQCMLYINGVLTQGLDTNHTDCLLEFDKEYDVYINLYTGKPNDILTRFDSPEDSSTLNLSAALVTVSSAVESLYYDIQVPAETLDLLHPKSDDYVTTLKHLELACNLLDLRQNYSDEFYASIEESAKYLKEEYYEKACGKSDAIVSCIGHTHIDVAWLWTLAQTEEKAQRSFATALELIRRYPEYIFMSSQPQLYEYVKKNDPELYGRIKEMVAKGRFEPEGAMWLEADCNLTSGESLVRQVMFGKRFFKEEFNVDSNVLWLPDVFGYSAALPQILKKSGVDKFVTSKISWNEQNCMPYDVFMWEGLDGTEIFTSFLTEQDYNPQQPDGETTATYVGNITPARALGSHNRFQQKEYSNRSLITFGYGDGGGGTTPKMLEYYRRMTYGLPGIPKVVIEPASEYLNKLESDFMESSKKLKKLPRWVGELYLEFHRGTYTSVAKNKKNNRDCEFLLQNAEQLSAMQTILFGKDYPQRAINSLWKTVLLNQFHDIIPGSSIKEVYDDSDEQYANVRNSCGKIISDALCAIASGVDKHSGTVVYNPNSFATDGYVLANGKVGYVTEVPPLGWTTIKEIDFANNVKVQDRCIENTYYKIDFDANCNIASIYDKKNNRQVIKPGCVANRLEAFEDLPYQFDNWELSAYYKQKMWEVSDVQSAEPICDGARAGMRIVRKFLNSTIQQDIYVYDNNPRIDFETKIDWKESHIVLKAAFPLDIHSDKATFETQFGSVERPTHQNTSWDAAKFEVCAHKWADISEDDYGVSLLNNCKYGHSVEGSTLKLTLLKCGTYPWDGADRCEHTFTYSLLPHRGNHKTGGTIEQAYLLNRPLIATPASGDGSIDDTFSLVSCNKPNIIIETIKKAEDNDGIIIRAYDSYNRRGTAEFTFGFDIEKAYLCDLMENKLSNLVVTNNRTISTDVSTFEIVTILVKPK